MNNGHQPEADTDLLTGTATIACAACGTALAITEKFCHECGVQRTAVPVPAGETATVTAPPEGDHTTATVQGAQPDGDHATATVQTAPTDVASTTPLPIVDATAVIPPDIDGEIPDVDHEPAPAANGSAPDDGSPAPAAWRRRRAPVVAIAVLVAASLVFGGLTAFNAMSRRPVVAALAAASDEFDDAMDTVAQAQDLAEISGVAADVPGWLHAIERHRDELDGARNTQLRSAVVDVLDAQLAYLLALRPLTDLDSASLSDWPPLAESMTDAASALEAASGRLLGIDAATQGDLSGNTSSATIAVEKAVALASADNAATAVRRAIDETSSASVLEEVRAGGAAAATSAAELLGALTTLEDLGDSDALQQQLTLQAAFLDELSSLESLTEDSLTSWPTISASLKETGTVMIAEMDLAARERTSLTSDLRQLRSQVDDVVTTARQRLRRWREEVRRAETARDEELAALSTYESGYRTHMERYNDLRDATADFTERIRDEYAVTYDEAYTAFYDGISQREEVREAMNALSPPDSVRSNHLAVVGVIDGAIAAMQSAVDGLADSQFCYFDCYYEDTAGWRRFQDESERITDDFASATAAWDAAITDRRSELENLELPPKPDI